MSGAGSESAVAIMLFYTLQFVNKARQRVAVQKVDTVHHISEIQGINVQNELSHPQSHTWRMLKVPDGSFGGGSHP